MLRHLKVLALFSLSAAAVRAQVAKTTPFARHEALALRAVTPNRTALPRFDKLELTLDLTATYDNPFDPDDVSVQAAFTAPQGQTKVIDGFLDQPFTRKLVDGAEKIESAGPPVWRVRFAPDVVGAWRYQVTVKDRSGSVTSKPAAFQVTPSTNPGFVHRSIHNPAVFAFAGEKPFFAVGENMGWGGKRGTFDYDDWLAPLGKAGGTWIRVWMSSWNGALEWSAANQGDWRSGTYHGVGVYSLDNAWKVDTILDTAERNGVYTMLCFGTYGEFKTGGFFGEGQWKANPYSDANGGPCAKPEDFWTNPAARKLYQRRLRYIMARYGYRTMIHSWEFWNEATAPAPWIAEMARFLKGTGEFAGHAADPNSHLLTTSYGSDEIWKLPEIDFTQTHNYGTGNIADHGPVVYNDARQHAKYDKPHLMGEFGIDWRKSDSEYDPQGTGVNLHNGLWAGVVSGDAGGGMIWWWDNYVQPKSVYQPFVAVSRFVNKVAWTNGVWKPLTTDAVRAAGGPETFTDYAITPTGGWGKSATTNLIVPPTGLASTVVVPQYLYSPGKADLRTTPSFCVNYAHPGQFIVHVNEVSDTSRLRFLLDSKPVRDVELSAVPPSGPKVKPEYEKTELNTQWKVYNAVFNKDYGIDVPAGAHIVTLDNAAGDWMTISTITLTGYRSSRYPEVNLYALANADSAIVWVQNALHNWKNVADKKPIPTLQGLQTTLHGLPAGPYAVEWWDTEKGVVTRTDQVSSVNGALVLHLPDVATDVAARIERRGN